MAPPSAYTAADLIEYLTTGWADILGVLHWDATSPQMMHIVNSAVRSSGQASIATISDPRRLELVAIREMWTLVAGNLASRTDYRNGDEQYAMEKLYGHAVNEAGRAQTALSDYDLSLPAPTDGSQPAGVLYVTGYSITPPVNTRRGRWGGERNY
jgi:hypothetical protein